MFSGIYYCILFIMCLKTNGIDVERIPITWKDNATEVATMNGNSVKINCQATGVPKPSIDTIFINKSFSSQTTFLPFPYEKADDVVVIGAVSSVRDHGVTFLCIASQAFNGKEYNIPAVALKRVKVNVYTKPTFEHGDELVVYSYLNESVSITCRVVTSNPPLQSLEFRHGKNDIITSNENYNVVVNLEMFSATLQIRALEEHHFLTNFACVANNRVYKSMQTIKIIKQTIPPEVIQISQEPLKNGRAASFEIYMNNAMPSKATFLNIKYAKMFNRALRSDADLKNQSSFTWHDYTAIFNKRNISHDGFACSTYTESHWVTNCLMYLLELDSAYVLMLQAGVSDWSRVLYAFTAEYDDQE